MFAIAVCSLAMAGALAACGQAEQQPKQAEPATSPASPDAKPGLSLSAAKIVLPVVPGNPAAAYFTLTNGGDKPVGVAGVHIEGAESTELHQTGEDGMMTLEDPVVPSKGSLKFEPGGSHVMVFGLDDTLVAAKTSEVTVTFRDGDKISAPIWIEAPGLSDRGDADHGAHN